MKIVKLKTWQNNKIAPEDISLIRKVNSPFEVKSLLVHFLEIPQDNKQRTNVAAELFCNAVKCCVENNLSDLQIATFLGILHEVFTTCVSTTDCNLQECYLLFKNLIVCHSIQRPPWNAKIFQVEQARALAKHVISSFFQHFQMYKFVFTPKLILDVRLREIWTSTEEEQEPIGDPEGITRGNDEKLEAEATKDNLEAIEQEEVINYKDIIVTGQSMERLHIHV